MASLDGVDPKKFGDGSFLPTGWNRVITGDCTLKYVGAKKTPQIEQQLFATDSQLSMKIQHWVSQKCIGGFVQWAEDLGVDREARRGMDTEAVETLEPLKDRNIWVLVDYREASNGKWYKEVTDWQPDSDTAPTSEPIHKTNPALSGGGQQRAARPAQSGGTQYSPPDPDDDDIPF